MPDGLATARAVRIAPTGAGVRKAIEGRRGRNLDRIMHEVAA